jgi:hypothetical protein
MLVGRASSGESSGVLARARARGRGVQITTRPRTPVGLFKQQQTTTAEAAACEVRGGFGHSALYFQVRTRVPNQFIMHNCCRFFAMLYRAAVIQTEPQGAFPPELQFCNVGYRKYFIGECFHAETTDQGLNLASYEKPNWWARRSSCFTPSTSPGHL